MNRFFKLSSRLLLLIVRMVLGFMLTSIITTFTSINPALCMGLINDGNVLVFSRLLQVGIDALRYCYVTKIMCIVTKTVWLVSLNFERTYGDF